MVRCASSVGALLLQLRETGAPADQLRYLQSCYQVTQKLLFSSFRGSGKPLIDHAVGTASYTAHLDPAITVIAAALLHPVYYVGVFPDGRRGMNEHNRSKLRAWVGPETEELVWRSETVRVGEHEGELTRAPDGVEALTKAAVRIQLANVADNLAGLGGALVPGAWYMKDENIRLFIRIAGAMGHYDFGQELLRLFEENRSAAEWASLLERDSIPDYEFVARPFRSIRTWQRRKDLQEARLRFV
jgi:(p)ppGpp synthase/HD superfamily hydrolase